MTRLWDRLIGRPSMRDLDDELQWSSLVSSYGTPDQERILPQFEQFAAQAFAGNSIVYALVSRRISLFSEAVFKYRSLADKHLFGTPGLEKLENPWPNGSTGEMLARMEQDSSLAGNSYIRDAGSRLERLRPDWVTIVSWVTEDEHGRKVRDVIGYLFEPVGDPDRGTEFYPVEEVVHWSPMPDPLANFRGMSWLTPVIRDINADVAMTAHREAFFRNAAPQPLDAKVLTPSGWTTMGAVRLGDEVIGQDGKAHEVIGVYPQGEQDIYRVTFSDGASAECTLDHVWRVASYADRKHGTYRTMSLADIVAAGIKYESGPRKWSIPLVEPVDFGDAPVLPMPAYLLGALLGDGSFRGNGQGSGGVSFSTEIGDADEWATRFADMLPAGASITRRDRGGWSEFYFKGPGSPIKNPVTEIVRDLGLFDVAGCDKSVPEVYLRASIADRVALLQGLIDTDGHVSASQANSVRFTNTSETLCRQLAELVGSLGGTASVIRVQRGSNKPQWTVTVKRLPESIIPCRLARKVARYSPACHVGRYRYIDRVEPVGRKQAQCIRVDYADHLYVTDDYVVTHNTPNMIIKYQQKLAPTQRDQIRDAIAARHAGNRNAFGTMVLDQGADMTVVGDRMQGSAFSDLQAAGEVRLAAAAGVPAIVAGLSQGRQTGAPGEYADAVRGFVDLTIRPNWRTVCSSLTKFAPPPPGSQLWFDTTDISALRQGEKDAADTMQVQAGTTNTLIMAGYEPDAVVQAVTAGDLTILVGKHSGLTSVQMHAPGEPADSATPPNPNSSSTEDGATPSGKGQPPPALGKSGRHRSDVEHPGAMIALIPSAADAARLSVAGGEPADDLHVTLVYLGVGADFNDHARSALTGTIGAVVADVAPIVADGFALSVFNPGDDSDRQSCIVLGLAGGELAEIHTSVSEATTSLLALVGPDLPAQPDPWSPHLTLIYTDQLGRIAELVDRVGPVTFDRVRIVFAGSTIDIPLLGEPHRGVGWSPGLHPRDPHNGEFAHTPGSKLVYDLNGAIGGGHEPRGARFPREVTAESLPVAGGHIRFGADASQPGSVDLAVGAGKLRLRDRDEVESLRKGFIKAEYAEHDRPVYVTRNRGGRNEVIAAIRPGHAAENDSGETVHTAFELVPGGEPAATNHDEIDRAAGVGLSIKDTKRIIDAAERAQASRRLDSGNGTLDTFTPRPGAIAFRMSDERGNPTEVSFNAGEWRRISKAIDVVTDGFDESKIPNGASDDFEPPEISQLVVKTAAGRVQITWNGPRDTGHQYPNWYNPAASLIVVPLYEAPWGIAVDGDHMLDVLNSVGSVADVSGIARSVVIGK